MYQPFQSTKKVTSSAFQSNVFSQSSVVNRPIIQSKQHNRGLGNLKYSQATYSASNQKPNQFYTSQANQINQPSSFSTSNVSQYSVTQFYKGLGSLPEDRLRFIAQNFIKTYGSGGQIRKHEVEKIQKIAHSNDNSIFQQSENAVNSLFEVMDQGTRDKRINEDDIYILCRKFLNCQKKAIVYTPLVEERLSVARRLFKQFDVEKKGYLTEKQVPNLLSETYRTLGKQFRATEDDIKSWMKLADCDGDGHVTLVQYERSIVRALKKQGIKIFED